MISYACMHGGSAGNNGSSENKSRQAAREEDELRAGCYQQDSSHTLIFLLVTHPVSFAETHSGAREDFIPMCCFSSPLCLKELSEQLVFSLSQVWLKYSNRISRITTPKIIFKKSTFLKKKRGKKKHTT